MNQMFNLAAQGWNKWDTTTPSIPENSVINVDYKQAITTATVTCVSCIMLPCLCQPLSLGKCDGFYPLFGEYLLKLFMTPWLLSKNIVTLWLVTGMSFLHVCQVIFGVKYHQPNVTCNNLQNCAVVLFTSQARNLSLWTFHDGQTDSRPIRKSLRSAGQEQNKINKIIQRRVWDWKKENYPGFHIKSLPKQQNKFSLEEPEIVMIEESHISG